ncbi:hypothetical protein [Flavobacterium aciduliphilum]|nr:hypothetical protein [Flavobacterium aciduliphilum]
MGDVVYVKKTENTEAAFAYHFSLLDIEGLDTILSNKNYYDGVTKSYYINLIKNQFERLKAEGIHNLKTIPGVCYGCKNGCSGFTFLDENKGFYMDFVVEVKNSEIINFMECFDLKNEVEVPNKREQIVIKPYKIDIDNLPF